MQKNSTAPSASQIPVNPEVLIRYSPENFPLAVASEATKALAAIQSVREIKNAKQLEAVSDTINEALITSETVEQFLGRLREQIQGACERVRELKGFEDFEATLTIRRWGLRQLLYDGLTRVKRMRAQFLADEQARVQREQLAAQAEQDRKNKKFADDAAKAAKAAGASPETIKEIKQAVAETPAPVVTSRALDVAAEAGASMRYTYSAEITSLKSFLGACLTNPVLFNTLGKAIPDIEKAFGAMARDQKELFKYPGLGVRKTPVDVAKRANRG